MKQIFKIIPIPPIYAPKNSTFKNLKPETKKAQRTLCSSIQPNPLQKNLRVSLCKNIFISLQQAQEDNRIKQIFKITPICVPKKSEIIRAPPKRTRHIRVPIPSPPYPLVPSPPKPQTRASITKNHPKVNQIAPNRTKSCLAQIKMQL